MGIRSYIGNKLFNIDRTVERKVEERMKNKLTYRVPGEDKVKTKLLAFRQEEYRIWAKSNPAELLRFYGTHRIVPGEHSGGERQLFWEWVSSVSNVPKTHYPAPESVLNHMKSLLFSDVLEITFETGNQKTNKKLSDRFDLISNDLDLYELLQTGSVMETYSGTLAFKFIFDSEVSSFPMIKPYPAERIRFRSKYTKVQEIIFEDYFKGKNDKTFTLNSIYGRGYIRYELIDDKDKVVPIDTLKETKDLKDIVILDKKTKKPIPLLLATWKKNRTTSNEFPEELYGGSDFEGIIDSFHLIDELYSLKTSYGRRTRPITGISETALPYDENRRKNVLPKEYEFDTLILKPSLDADKMNTLFQRDVPEVDFTPYDDAILSEMKTIYQKIGMAYTSVGLEAHSANISGAALETKEKSTLIVRANKIKLWNKFLKDTVKLLLIYEDLNSSIIREDKDQINIEVDNLYENLEINIEFPAYNNQTFEEKIEAVSKAINAQVMDIESAVRRAFPELSEEEIKIMVRNIKIENGIPIIEGQMVDNDGAVIEEEPLQDLIPEEAVADDAEE